VDMKNTVGEPAQKGDIIHTLITKVGRVVVKSERRMTTNRIKGTLCGTDVKGDFCRGSRIF
jgi:hypothetical protein